jgi:uncharacterized protein YbbC (DUF1343 family)
VAAIRFGSDRVAARPDLLGRPRRIGLVTCDAARTAAHPDRPGRAQLLDAGLPIVRLFAPEHGLAVAAPDGAAVGDGVDPVTGLPVTSLYGPRLRPPPDTLAGLDLVVCDLPDLGVRCYTYAWTMTHVIDACAAAGVPVAVLDRPDPLGGRAADVEGPVLEPAFASFIGRHTIPLRHGLTIGELAVLWQRDRRPDADVRVVACAGWRREWLWPDLDLPFVPTSPAIRRYEAALFYAGLCVFEATNLSVARGTDLSFEAVGAPWLDAARLASRVADRRPPGVAVEPVRFTPGTGPYAGEACNGLRLHAIAPHAVRPVALGLALLADVARLHADAFAWAPYPTAANPAGTHHFERLLGTGRIRPVIEAAAGSVDAAVLADWTAAPRWAARHRAVVRYD